LVISYWLLVIGYLLLARAFPVDCNQGRDGIFINNLSD